MKKFILLVLLSCFFGCTRLPNSQIYQHNNSQLSYSLAGQQTPTVVFQSGLGDGQNTWQGLTKHLGQQQYFIFDRPGYGGSSAANTERSACQQADELHQLLKVTGVQPPYLLVGHSLGGLYQYVFALKYPQEVAGLLLLDPTHPKHWQYLQARSAVATQIIKIARATAFSATMRREFDDQEKCLDSLAHLKLAAAISQNTILATSTRINPVEGKEFAQILADERQDWQKILGIGAMHSVIAGHYIHKDNPQEVIKLINRQISATNTTAKNY